MKPWERVAFCPLFEAEMSTRPTVPVGTVTSASVLERTLTFVALLFPNLTVIPATKPPPISLTLLPPTGRLVSGETDLRENWLGLVALLS